MEILLIYYLVSSHTSELVFSFSCSFNKAMEAPYLCADFLFEMLFFED